MGLVRTNITLPEETLALVDAVAGPRGRSRYVAEAVAQRVRRDSLGAAIRETAGAMVGKPGWMSPGTTLADTVPCGLLMSLHSSSTRWLEQASILRPLPSF